MRASRIETLYAANVAILTTHQVDAAFWHEWDVFGVPGGVRFFLAFNLVAVLVLARGLGAVAAARPSARRYALACAALGLFTVALHAVFLAVNRVAFWTLPSLALLAATALVSSLLLSGARRSAIASRR